MNIQKTTVQKLSIITISMCSLLLPVVSQAEVAVIVNQGNDSNFDQADLKKLFLGKSKQFSNGRTAILISPPAGDNARKEFNEKVLGKSDNQVNAYWSKMLFTGKGIPPQEMGSANEIISAIKENKDAISYIDASAVTADVKVVGKF